MVDIASLSPKVIGSIDSSPFDCYSPRNYAGNKGIFCLKFRAVSVIKSSNGPETIEPEATKKSFAALNTLNLIVEPVEKFVDQYFAVSLDA